MKKIWFHIVKNYRIYFCLTIVLILFSSYSDSKTPKKNVSKSNFRTMIGEKYNEALFYLISNSWIADTIRAYQVDPVFAQAIVFPEIVRYSSIRDKIEVAGLFSLYINYGENYANFSVGHFQMKPSFAQNIEKDALKYGLTDSVFTNNFSMEDSSNDRFERVKRLNSPIWQVRYLIAFVKILEKLYSAYNWENCNEKIRFFATAYNCGYWHQANYIKQHIKRKLFYTSIVPGSNRYCYSDISIDFYQLNKK